LGFLDLIKNNKNKTVNFEQKQIKTSRLLINYVELNYSKYSKSGTQKTKNQKNQEEKDIGFRIYFILHTLIQSKVELNSKLNNKETSLNHSTNNGVINSNLQQFYNLYYLHHISLNSVYNLNSKSKRFKDDLLIDLIINFKNSNCKINMLRDKGSDKYLGRIPEHSLVSSYFLSYGIILKKLNLLQKSLRRSKKYYSLLVNNFKNIFNTVFTSRHLKSYELKNINKVNLNISIIGHLYLNRFTQSLILSINDVLKSHKLDRIDNKFGVFLIPNYKNSNNTFKKIKAIKKRIKKKLIKKYYKS